MVFCPFSKSVMPVKASAKLSNIIDKPSARATRHDGNRRPKKLGDRAVVVATHLPLQHDLLDKIGYRGTKPTVIGVSTARDSHEVATAAVLRFLIPMVSRCSAVLPLVRRHHTLYRTVHQYL